MPNEKNRASGAAIFLCAAFQLLLVLPQISAQTARPNPPARPSAPAPSDPLQAARQHVTKGEYKEAIEKLEPLVKGNSATEAMPLLMESLLATGEYRNAAEQGEEYLTRRAEPPVMVLVAEAWS